MQDRAERVFAAGESEDVDRRFICLEEIVAAGHVAAGGDVFKIVDRAPKTPDEPLFFTGNKSGFELQLLLRGFGVFFVLGDLGVERLFLHGNGGFGGVAAEPFSVLLV